MTEFTRRAALHGIGAAGAAALAGCTEAGGRAPGGDGTDGGDDGNGTDGDDGSNGGDDDGDGTDGADGGVETAVQQVGSALLRGEWNRVKQRGYCVLIGDESDAERLLAEAPESVRAFVEETDFAESVVLYVESVGPTTCHDEIAFDGVGIEDGTLVADATVLGAEDDGVACGEAITYPAAVLRVTGDSLPDAARLSVTDGWGRTGTIRNGEQVTRGE